MEKVKPLGCNIWWTVPQAKMLVAKAREALVKFGFDESEIRNPNDRRAFSRAVKQFNKVRGHQLARKISDNPAQTVYGIVNETVDVDESALDYEIDTTVILNKTDGTVTATGSLDKELLEMYKSFQGHITGHEIRCFLRNVIHSCSGIPKRPSGGIYFIPENQMEVIDRCSKALAEIGSTLYVERVWDGPQERGNVWDSAEQEIEKMLEETCEKILKIEKRAKALGSQEAKLGELQKLMEVYQGLLGDEAKAESLINNIKGAVDAVTKKMEKVQLAATKKKDDKKAVKNKAKAEKKAVRDKEKAEAKTVKANEKAEAKEADKATPVSTTKAAAKAPAKKAPAKKAVAKKAPAKKQPAKAAKKKK